MNSSLLTVMTGAILYLGLGILSDILISAYTVFVGKELRFQASLTSTLVSFLSLYLIVKYFVKTPSDINIIAFAVGNGVGTFILMTLSKHLKKKKK